MVVRMRLICLDGMIFIVNLRLLIGVGYEMLRWIGSFRLFGCYGIGEGMFDVRLSISWRMCLCHLGLLRCWSSLLILHPHAVILLIMLRLCTVVTTCCEICCLVRWIFIECSSRWPRRLCKGFCFLLFCLVSARYIIFTFIYLLRKSFTFLCKIKEILC